ncbi:aldose 1-epimerase [Novosphingobium sp. FSW06-99]|uniref:aldose 1-epimerase n=1 Tax=Novosphingobium sp. FSW06-99 TaxID=1739113 RepID=UPI00076C57EC|nr:aldose 1-epimerase [Novosphingobium sp. FSW06-99]KUR79406.1 hypothetical protein AQZ49_05635 [Novosphingobium sp. FSW06-99]
MTTTDLIELHAGDYRLVLEPTRGGSIARFDWHDIPLLRPTCGPAIFDTGCFPLVPFSNRIADGVFRVGQRTVHLKPNFPGSDHPHPLHGFGWLCAWTLVEHTTSAAVVRHQQAPGAWPWAYVAEQHFQLGAGGLCHEIRLRNLADEPMPAGLGFHPYFPRSQDTRYTGLHRGEWQLGEDGLPSSLHQAEGAIDWWHGEPVGARAVDTVYTGRIGALRIVWPETGLALTIEPSANLPCTVVYTPQGEDYFCVEPVSHATDAINHPERGDGMTWLAPGETMTVSARYAASAWPTG